MYNIFFSLLFGRFSLMSRCVVWKLDSSSGDLILILQPMNIKKQVGILNFLFKYWFSCIFWSNDIILYIYYDVFFFPAFILKTATCYRVAKQFGQAKDYLLKASDCYKENRSLFHAARCYEQVWRLFLKFIISFKKNYVCFFFFK